MPTCSQFCKEGRSLRVPPGGSVITTTDSGQQLLAMKTGKSWTPKYTVSVSHVRQRRSQPVPSANCSGKRLMNCPHASPLVIQGQQIAEPPEPAESSSINQRTSKYWHGVKSKVAYALYLTRMAHVPIRCAGSDTCAQSVLTIS